MKTHDTEDAMPALPTAQSQQAEQRRLERSNLVQDLFGKTEAELRLELEGAASEIDREMGVRSRIYADWIKDGKISKIDATDRYNRMKKAGEIIHFLLDIIGETPRMTTDDVPF